MTRRDYLRLAAAIAARPVARAAGERLAVLYHSGGEAYVEAVSGMRAVLAAAAVEAAWIDVAAGRGKAVIDDARLVVALGTAGWEAAAGARPPVLAAMVAQSDARLRSMTGAASLLYLDVPFASELAELRGVLPGKSRAGLIRRAGEGPDEAALAARARQAGYQLALAECGEAGGLLPAFLSLKTRADFVLTTPDTRLFNSATVKPLILASLENRLPLVGFSAGFVRAGAALGVYPDFREMGRQAAEMALRWLAGSAAREESPRALVTAVNQRVLRLMGLEWNQRHRDVQVFR